MHALWETCELFGKIWIFTDFSWNSRRQDLFFSHFLKYLLFHIDFIICAIVYYIIITFCLFTTNTNIFQLEKQGEDVFFTEISIYM